MSHYGVGAVGFGQAETVQSLAAGSVILVPTGGQVSPIGWSGIPYTVDNPLKAVLTAEEVVTGMTGRTVLLTSGATVQSPRPVVVLDTGIGASVTLDAGTRIRVLTDSVDVVSAASGSTWTEAPEEPVEEGCPAGWTMIKGRCVETIIVPPAEECPDGWFRNSVGECEAVEEPVSPPPADEDAAKPWYKTTTFYVSSAVGGALALGTVLWAALRKKR